MSFSFTIFYPDKKNLYKPSQSEIKKYIGQSLGINMEAYGGPSEGLGYHNGFHDAVRTAFSYEMPLALSPDHVWMAILQVFSEYVNTHAEELRSKFVNFDGKKVIEIRRDGFVRGNPEQDWSGVFEEFIQKIKEHTGSIYEVISANFSTTGPVERAAVGITFMDSMQKYFDYVIRTCCGIPRVTLLGDPLDWLILRKKAEELGKYGLDWWMKDLLPVLDEFYFSSQGQPNLEWWKSFYHYRGGSGVSEVSGHIRVFFPKDGKVLSVVDAESQIPKGWSSVPVKWLYYSQSLDMEFVAGMKNAIINEKGEIQPAVFWAVGEKIK
jgi:hypothetical protein